MRLHARLLLRDALPLPQPCDGEQERTSTSAAARLMQAIIIAETHAAPRLERVFEAVVVRTADALHLPLPDLSIGPAQLRPATVLKAFDGRLQASAAIGTEAPTAPQLLDHCESFRAGIGVIAWIARENGIALVDPNANEIRTIAHHYNGGSKALEASDIERALAVQLYGSLVYHIYQELTFRTLQEKPAG